MNKLIRSKSDKDLEQVITNYAQYDPEFTVDAFNEFERRESMGTLNNNFYSNEFNDGGYLSKFSILLQSKKLSEIRKIVDYLDQEQNPKLYKEAINVFNKMSEHTSKQNSHRKMTKYAGFGVRAGANIIDALIFIPVALITLYLMTTTYIVLIFVQILMLFFYSAYTIYYHGKYGATIGKKAMSIKVVRLNESDISWKEAILRSSVDIIFSLLRLIGTVIALLYIPKEVFNSLGMFEITAEITKHTPDIFHSLEWLTQLWFLSELLVLLFNKKKRAIHDFIAGTIVIHK